MRATRWRTGAGRTRANGIDWIKPLAKMFEGRKAWYELKCRQWWRQSWEKKRKGLKVELGVGGCQAGGPSVWQHEPIALWGPKPECLQLTMLSFGFVLMCSMLLSFLSLLLLLLLPCGFAQCAALKFWGCINFYSLPFATRGWISIYKLLFLARVVIVLVIVVAITT